MARIQHWHNEKTAEVHRVKLFFENSLWSSIISLENKRNSLEPPILACSSVWSWRSESFDKLNFLSFGLADDQKSFNAACNSIFLHFLSSHYGFLHYFEMFSFLSSNNTPGRVHIYIYHLCWICTSNKNKALKTIKFSFSAIF